MAGYGLKLFVLFTIFVANSFGLALDNKPTVLATVVAEHLEECYNNSEILIRDNKLPMSLPVLIDIIRKIENGPDKIDFSSLVVAMLHRFRQDGIVKAQGVDESTVGKGVLLWSPNNRYTNDKFKVLLRYIIPGSADRFPNDTLTVKERCTLHSMMSSSIEDWERGDEAKVCNKLGKYVRRLNKRSTAMRKDVEYVDTDTGNPVKGQSGNMVANPDVERIGKLNHPKSDCPVETGVFYTNWGTVAAGPLLAGLAAGAQPERISVKSIRPDISNNEIQDIDNIYPATLAGDLAEAALYKNEDDPSAKMDVGASGGWNSTTEPHWYFLHKTSQTFLTDAEIRGGLDGLILGKLYKDKLSKKYRSLKLSQLLDMYYSKGVMGDEEIRACHRRELWTKFTTEDELRAQTEAFAVLLNREVRLSLSYQDVAVKNLVDDAIKSLWEYIPSRLNDPSCVQYKDSDSSSAYTDLFIAVDLQWDLEELRSILYGIMEGLDLNMYTGNYTIINAYDGSILINSTNVHYDISNLNKTFVDNAPKGVDMVKTIRQIEELSKALMNDEKSGIQRGRSLTSLLILSQEPTIENYVVERIRDYINIFEPDLKFFVLTKGKKEVFANIVKDQTRDVVTITGPLSTNGGSNTVRTQLAPLIERIKEVPRRFVNPNCGADWKSGASNVEMIQYLDQPSINYYRIPANYFFEDGSRSIKIKSMGNTPLTVCYSRSNMQPRANQSATNSGDVTCQSGQEYSISLAGACKDKTFIHECMPLYFSVETGKSEVEDGSCTDDQCRFANSVKVSVFGENLVCQSSAWKSAANVLVCLSLALVVFFKSSP